MPGVGRFTNVIAGYVVSISKEDICIGILMYVWYNMSALDDMKL